MSSRSMFIPIPLMALVASALPLPSPSTSNALSQPFTSQYRTSSVYLPSAPAREAAFGVTGAVDPGASDSPTAVVTSAMTSSITQVVTAASSSAGEDVENVQDYDPSSAWMASSAWTAITDPVPSSGMTAGEPEFALSTWTAKTSGGAPTDITAAWTAVTSAQTLAVEDYVSSSVSSARTQLMMMTSSKSSIPSMAISSNPSLFPSASPTIYAVPAGSMTQSSSSSSSSMTASPTPSATSSLAAQPLDMKATKTSWTLDPSFTNIESAFSISSYADGSSNFAIVPAATASPSSEYTVVSSDQAALSANSTLGSQDSNLLRVFYPQGSVNPANQPVGGGEFYAKPMDIYRAENVTLEYSVFFPTNFSFVQGGKLPGLYGGHEGCSGGDAATNCFSTRMMWRTNGLGELYLYAPKDKQSSSLCHTKPKSVCDAAWGLSIGRGAFSYATGGWTHIRQDVWLNTPGQQDGGFNIWINGNLAISANDVFYRSTANATASATAIDNNLEIADTAGPDNANNDTTISAKSIASVVNLNLTSSPVAGLIHVTILAINSNDTSDDGIAQAMAVAAGQSNSDTQSMTPSATIGSLSFPTGGPSELEDDIAAIEAINALGPGHHQSQNETANITITLPQQTISASTRGLMWSGKPMDAFATPSTSSKASSSSIASPSATTVTATTITSTMTRIATVTVHATSTSTPSPSPLIVLPTIIAVAEYAEPSAQAATPSGQSSTQTLSSTGFPIDLMDYTVVEPSNLNSTDPSTSTPIQRRSLLSSRSQDGHVDGNGTVGFIGIFFSTFFGGHTSDWASPEDQYSYFKDFSLAVNA